jgi:hypothetical protein
MRPRGAARARIAAFGGALSLLLAGCGLGAGGAPTGVQLTVSENFGAHLLPGGAVKVAGEETAMRLLMRNYTVKTRYGGGFVQSIDGISGGEEGGEPVDWFYYVNGLEAAKGAAATKVHAGEHIWWDRHDWSQAQGVPAVVGSYPEPFLDGYGGRRYPVRIECASVTSPACRTVTNRLRALGVPAAIAAIGSGGEPEVIQLIVGTWKTVLSDPGTQSIEDGPGKSGVYARFAPDGSSLTLLDADGRAVRTLRSGAGLIAATRQEEQAPVWVVTGTDEAGLDRAAEALDEQALQDHFALAVAPQGTVPLPVSAE